MHRCLGILEIVELICAHLGGDPLSATQRKDFAALARTSKDFQNPALNELWRQQTTLTNLLKCLPSNLWVETIIPRTRGISRFRIVGATCPADWERPLEYGRRVRILTLSARTFPLFPAVGVFHTISSSLPQDWLFPNLRQITWDPKADSIFSYVSLFLGPLVTSVSLSPAESHVPLLATPALVLRLPQLKSLSIDAGPESSRLCRTVSEIVLGLDRIQLLSLDAVDRQALEHLSRLPSLQLLRLHRPGVHHLGPPTLPRTAKPAHPFPALRFVEFLASTIAFTVEFVELLTDCFVYTFTLGTDDLATTASTSELYGMLASHLAHGALQHLSVNNVDDGISMMPTPPAATMADYAISGHILAVLFCFGNLTHLTLQPPVGFDINDTTAGDMARAWPRMIHLQLTSGTDLHCPPRMTLHGLRAFAEHCTDLEWLCITIDASTVPPFDQSLPTRTSSQHKLHDFDVAGSPISEPPPVARFLSGLFPNLERIRTVDYWSWVDPVLDDAEDETFEERAYSMRWKQVEALVPMIAAIRREEREWAQMATA